MEQSLDQTIALLERTPGALDELLRGLPDSWTNANEGYGTWTALEVINHLIDCELVNWMPRLRHLLAAGESEPFKPFDRTGFKADTEPPSLAKSLSEFTRLRAGNLEDLRALGLTTDDLEKRGKHPTFGAVTASQLLATWAVHDMTQLHQISRILAHQYQEAVGPWRQYLGVLQRAGHSSS